MGNLVEKFTNMLLNNKDSAIIAKTDIVLNIADELRDLGNIVEGSKFAEDAYILLLTKVGEFFFLEYPFNDNLEIIKIEDNLILLQDGVLEDEEISCLECEKLIMFSIDEYVQK